MLPSFVRKEYTCDQDAPPLAAAPQTSPPPSNTPATITALAATVGEHSSGCHYESLSVGDLLWRNRLEPGGCCAKHERQTETILALKAAQVCRPSAWLHSLQAWGLQSGDRRGGGGNGVTGRASGGLTRPSSKLAPEVRGDSMRPQLALLALDCGMQARPAERCRRPRVAESCQRQ